MSLADVSASFAKLEARHGKAQTQKLIGKLKSQVVSLRDEVAAGRMSFAEAGARLKQEVDRFQASVAEEQKELYNAQSRHAKAVAKRFKTDLTSAAAQPDYFSDKRPLINQAIMLEFVRQGQFDLAERMAQEAGVELDREIVDKFRDMHAITAALGAGDLAPAIRWCRDNRSSLERRDSTLEFELHRRQFVKLFRTAHVFDTMRYATENFPQFATRHAREIAQLMGSFAFGGARIDASPYRHIFAPAPPPTQQFVTEFTALLHMTPTSPLLTTVQAAVIAMPTLLKFSALKFAGERPGLDIQLPAAFRFHSVFVCPVTKEVGGDAYMLPCGHVIGAEAMHSLARNSTKVKCPYCPALNAVKQAVKLNF